MTSFNNLNPCFFLQMPLKVIFLWTELHDTCSHMNGIHFLFNAASCILSKA